MTKVLIYLFVLAGVFQILAIGCKKDDEKNLTVPVLTTTTVTNITQTTAITGGEITSNGGATITACGVYWSTDPNPVLTGSKTTDSARSGDFIHQISGLNRLTTYYVCAYATNRIGIGYGKVLSFITKLRLTDIDGNEYDTVILGTQVWMKQNLNVTHFRNGDPITYLSWGSLWYTNYSEAYCDYSNSPDTSKIYGRLYNWYALNDNRNIAPDGWHVATYDEWAILINYLGGEKVAGSKIKEAGNIHWVKPNSDATNESGFTALPGGSIFSLVGHNGHWWTSTTDSISDNAWYLTTSHLYSDLLISLTYKNKGYSVRCVKD